MVIFADTGEEVTEYIQGGHLQCKWLKGLCPIPGGSSPDSGKIKILSKHLLPQFRVREFLARASLIAVWVQCRPDFPLENLSMDVGPARQPRSPLVFQVGAEPHFPHLERFPTLSVWKSVINKFKRLGSAFSAGFWIQPPSEPVFSSIKFIIQLAFFRVLCKLHVEVLYEV